MLLTFVFLFLGALLNPGQGQAPFSLVRVNAPDAEITDVGWTTPPAKASKKAAKPDPHLDPLGMPPTSTGELPNPLERSRGGDEWVLAPPASRANPSPDESKATVYVGIKNTGTKAITAIDGEITFGNRTDGSEFFVLQFRSKQEVPPGQSLSLSKKFQFDEKWRRLQQAVQNKSAKVKASIAGLEYYDGSSWKR